MAKPKKNGTKNPCDEVATKKDRHVHLYLPMAASSGTNEQTFPLHVHIHLSASSGTNEPTFP